MLCSNCGKRLIKAKDHYTLNSIIVGEISIPNINYEICPNCSYSLISIEESIKVSNFVKKLEKEEISKQPVNMFVGIREAAEILEISTQALSVNGRIRRGLIMFCEKGGIKLYLTKSVHLYKEKRNGLYRLS